MLVADGGPPEDRLTPQDAFAILGNEYRSEIIRTLGEEQGSEGPRPQLSFSELYSKAAVDITTSQFNYHLQKLVGPFIDKTEKGYRLRHEAVTIYRTILAGTYTRNTRIEQFPVGGDCFYCNEPIEARYTDRRFTVLCAACDREYSVTTAPPSIVEGDRGALLNRMDQYIRHRVLAFSKGVCSICATGLDTQFLPGEELAVSGSEQLDVLIHRSCTHCGAQQYMSVGLSLLYNSSLIAFFQERGIDITSKPIWELEFAMTDRFVNIRSTDPWEIALCIKQDDDELELVIDNDLSVLSESAYDR